MVLSREGQGLLWAVRIQMPLGLTSRDSKAQIPQSLNTLGGVFRTLPFHKWSPVLDSSVGSSPGPLLLLGPPAFATIGTMWRRCHFTLPQPQHLAPACSQSKEKSQALCNNLPRVVTSHHP